MSRTFRNIPQWARTLTKFDRTYLGIEPDWCVANYYERVRESIYMGYDGKPRSLLYWDHIRSRGWSRDYFNDRITRRFCKRSARRWRRRQPIEME